MSQILLTLSPVLESCEGKKSLCAVVHVVMYTILFTMAFHYSSMLVYLIAFTSIYASEKYGYIHVCVSVPNHCLARDQDFAAS